MLALVDEAVNAKEKSQNIILICAAGSGSESLHSLAFF